MGDSIKMSDKDYFGSDYAKWLSKSRLWSFADDPVGFANNTTKYNSNSESLVLGSAFHMLLLEGEEEYKKHYTVIECTNPRTRKPYGRNTKTFKSLASETENELEFVLSDHMHEQIVGMVDAVKLVEEVYGELAACSRIEEVLRGVFENNPTQGKVDAMRPNENDVIYDIKTCRDIESFLEHFYDYGYDWQSIIYCDLYEQVFGIKPEFKFVAVSKEPEPDVYVLSAEMMHSPKREWYLRHCARVYRKCVEAGDWSLALFELEIEVPNK